MATVAPPAIFSEIIDFLASTPTPQQLIDFNLSEELQNRAHELMERNRQGTLTTEERAELEEFLHMNHFMVMLKLRAGKNLAKP